MDLIIHKIRKQINKKVEERCLEVLKDLIEIYSENHSKDNDLYYKLLNYSRETLDYFDLVIIESFLETMYLNGMISEELTDNKRLPKGSNNSYGKYFEEKVIYYISEIYELKSKQEKYSDAIFKVNDEFEFLLEVKCSKTNTDKQVSKYLDKTGIQNFVTINGSENYINFTFFDFYRKTKKITEEIISDYILMLMEEN